VNRRLTLAILATLSASIALAEDFKTIKGKEYSRVETDGIVLEGKSGIKVYFTELPKEVADKWRANQVFATAGAAEEKRIEAQKAAARERAEKQKGFNLFAARLGLPESL
jgi:hypothetical protein